MFDFFKKKKVEIAKEPVVSLTSEQIQGIQKNISLVQLTINDLEATDRGNDEELAKRYEELGLLLAQLTETDRTIDALEKSLFYKKSIGDGYKKLMSLYNQKRKEAAVNGDAAGIDTWMNKMDEMRQIAKKVTISGS